MASRSSCELKARPQPLAEGECSSQRPNACGAGIIYRWFAWVVSVRLTQSTDWPPRWRFLVSARGPSAHWALTGLTAAEIEAGLGGADGVGALVHLPVGPRRTIRILAEYAADLEERALRALGRLHAAHPRHSAIPKAQLVAAFPDLANDALAAGIIERLREQGKVLADSRRVMLRGFQPKLSHGDRKLKAELAERISAGEMSPPDVAELAAAAGPRASAVADLLALLRDEGELVEINPQLYLDAHVESDLRRRVSDRLADGSTLTMAELRDLLDTTRKYAVPIGEYLDRIGLTRREGDAAAGSV